MSIESSRNDISTETSPQPGEGDNLGAEDGKGEPPTVVPSDSDDEDEVLAEDPTD